MSKELKLTVHGIPPSVNHYLGFRGVKKGKGCMVMSYTKPEAKQFQKDFEEYAKEQVKLQNWDIEQTRHIHHYMDCVFYFDRTDKDSQNYFKVMSDVLNGIAYIDDRTILTRTFEQYYDSENPRIEITIHPVTYRGIFNSEQHMNEFEKNCKQCKRYARNCSILNKAKEGRIQKEIDQQFVCSKFNIK